MGQALTRSFAGTARGKDIDEPSEMASLPYHQSRQRAPQPGPGPQKLEDDCHIQPHTDEGGDAYYIGDAYEPAKCANEWAIDTYVRGYERLLGHSADSSVVVDVEGRTWHTSSGSRNICLILST